MSALAPRFRRLWPLFLFVGFACLFLWRVTLAGQAFVPAQLLRHATPWAASYAPENRPVWNPLMYDSAGQFYPWRAFAAETLRTGYLPLWNPYQFCGTPFVANSQSAVFYPPNLLYVLLSPVRAAGWNALLHLVLAAAFMWLFLRQLGADDPAGAAGGIAYAFSTWQSAWLHLPTFLATSCWLPLILLLTLRLFETRENPAAGRRFLRGIGLGFAVGMALLAGHLQIAFYALLAAGLLAAGLSLLRRKDREPRAAVTGILAFGVALILGGMIAAPQVFSALDLSRHSHRTAPPSAEGYRAYVAYAVSPDAIATLFMPDFFGNPSEPGAPYFGTSRGGAFFNYAEGACYVGLLPLLLAAFFLLRPGADRRKAIFLGGLALLSLGMAFGTAVDALFYFYVPGFGQSGSPGRSLVLWTFAVAALAGLGTDRMLRAGAEASENRKPLRFALLAAGIVAAIGCAAGLYGMGAIEAARTRFGDLPWQPQIPRQAGFFLLAAFCLLAAAAGKLPRGWGAALPMLLMLADLFASNLNYNPTAPPAEVYPSTPAIAYLKQAAGHDRVLPVNNNWSFAGPQAVLPPNGAMVFGLRDVQGYDSLFLGQYKNYMNQLAGRDSSPPEVGNMVFARDPYSPMIAQMGVRCILSLAPLTLPGATETVLDGIYIYSLPGAPGRATARTEEGAPIPVTWNEDRPTRVALRVESPAPAALRLADQNASGWRAAIDGKRAPIEWTDQIFRLVRVPAGRHAVTFRYQPAPFQCGLYLMLLAAAIGTGGLVFCMKTATTDDGRRTTDNG